MSGETLNEKKKSLKEHKKLWNDGKDKSETKTLILLL